MKKYQFIWIALIVSFIACSEDNKKKETDDDDQEPVENVSDYTGTLKVDQLDSTFYRQENVVVTIDNENNAEFGFVMQKVKFAPKMPFTIDMHVSDIVTRESGDTLFLGGNNIIPTIAGGTPFPQYTITNLQGTLTSDSLAIKMMCGKYPLEFSGKK